jgi:hypothetical protein
MVITAAGSFKEESPVLVSVLSHEKRREAHQAWIGSADRATSTHAVLVL